MEGRKIAFDLTIDLQRSACLLCLSLAAPHNQGVCVGSNKISHYSAGSSQGPADNKISDARSVLLIVTVLYLLGYGQTRPQSFTRDTVPFVEGLRSVGVFVEVTQEQCNFLCNVHGTVEKGIPHSQS